MVGDFFGAAADALQSPVGKWRLMVFAAFLGVAVHIAWACGLIPGVPGFAMSADVQSNTAQIETVKKAVDCNAIEAEIKRLRSERRDNETKMIEAQQSGNQQLITQLQRVISEIADELDDELERRRTNGCTSA